MTLAATRQYALALSAIVGVVAGIFAAALISAVLGSPERVVLAMNDDDLSSIVYLILDRLEAVAAAIWRVIL
jgi:hypothetical protein